MATKRSINIELKLDGEKEARDAITSLNRELKTLDAELKRNDAQYGATEKSAKGLAEQYEILNRKLATQKEKWKETYTALQYAGEAASKAAKEVAEAQEELEKARTSLESSGLDKASDAYEELANAVKKAEEAYLAAEKAQQNADINVQKWTTSLVEADTAQLKTAQSMEQITETLEKSNLTVEQASTGLFQLKENLWESIDAASAALAGAGLVKGFEALKDGIMDCAQASRDWESAFTGVRKTVEASDEELAALNDSLLEMSTRIPLAKTELAGIAELAGQLGIETEHIASFTETVAAMAASTNLAAEDAATSMARIANVTQTAAEDYGRMGSTIVALGNNFATTESEIVNMTLRLSAAGTQAGMTLPEIMGLSAALSSMGMSADSGGSAMSKMIKKVQLAVETGSESLTDYAEVAGMTADAFARLWSEDSATAMQRMIEGIADVERNSASITKTLDELGVTELRTSDAMGRLANNHEMLSDAIALANSAWAENTALMQEAETRYSTTESKMTMAANAAEQFKIAIGDQLNPVLEAGAGAFGDLALGAADFVREHEGTAAVIVTIATALGTLATAGTAAMVIAKIGPALVAAFSGPVGAVIGLTAALAGAAAGWITYSASQKKGTDELAQATEAITEGEKAFEKYSESAEKAASSYEESTKAAQESAQTVQAQIDLLEQLTSTEDASAAQKQQIKAVVGELNNELEGLNLSYDELSGTLNRNISDIRSWADQAAQAAIASAELQNIVDQTVAMQNAREASGKLEKDIAEQEALLDAVEAKIDARNQEIQRKRITTRGYILPQKEQAELQDWRDEAEDYRQKLAALYEEQTTVTFAIFDAQKAIEESTAKYNELTGAAKGAAEGLESTADSAERVADNAKESALSLEELQEQLEKTKDAKETLEDNINDVGDAVYEALKNKAQAAYDATVDGIRAMQDAEEAASAERIAVWEAEYQEKAALIAASAAEATASIQAQIDELNALTAAQSERLDELNAEQKLEKDIEGRASTAASKSKLADKARAELEGLSGQYAAILKEYDAAAEATRDGFAESIAALGDEYAAVLDDYQRRIEQANAVASEGIGAIVDAATENERKRAQAAQKEIEALQKQYDELIKKAQSDTDELIKKAQSNTEDEKQKETVDKLKEKQKETVDKLKAELEKKLQTQLDIIAAETTARQKAYDKASEDAAQEAAQRQIELALERNARLLELAQQRTADEQAMYDELERIRADYETKIAAAESDVEKAQLKNDLAMEEAEQTEKIVKSRSERVNALLALIEEQNNGEIDLNREQYDKLLELMKGSGGKERDLVDELYRYRRDTLVEYGEFQQKQTEAARKDMTEELQATYDAVVESSSLLSEETKKVYEGMAEDEKAALAEYVASCQARIDAAKAVLDAETDTAKLRDETLKALQTGTNNDLVALLKQYNPEWESAGAKWTDMLAGGVSSGTEKLKTAVGASVSAAMAELGALSEELDKLNKQAEEIGKDYAAGVDEGVRKSGYGKKAGIRLSRDLTESTKDALEIHSPSRVGISIGENFASSIGTGLMNKIRDIREAGTRAAAAMSFSASAFPELAARTEIAARTAVTAQAPDLVAALKNLKIQSIGYNQQISFNGQTSPYQAARQLKQAMEEALR
nr:MAG TPA: minor tail protein [Caudoviricetes sp.]